MKRTIKMISIALCALALSSAAADGTYALSLLVGKGQTDSDTVQRGTTGKKRGGVKTETITSSTTWPVSVTCLGTGRPSKLTLVVYYIGTHNSAPIILKQDQIDVALDDNGNFKRDLVSPQLDLTKTAVRKRVGNGRNRRRRGKASNLKTESSGERVTGCIVQLLDNGTLVRSFASNPSWAKAARLSPLPEEEVLKFR